MNERSFRNGQVEIEFHFQFQYTEWLFIHNAVCHNYRRNSITQCVKKHTRNSQVKMNEQSFRKCRENEYHFHYHNYQLHNT